MKSFAFLFFLGFSLSASAQYLGGSGDGDIKTGISSKLLDGSAGSAAWFYGGSGDGDIKASITNKLLDGTTATPSWFYGGSGDGDVKSTRVSSTYLGEVEWVGSTSTDWNTTSNWRQNALPPDGRVKINTNAVRDLYLDQNRTINTLDFNGVGRKVFLGNFDLTVNTGFTGANSSNYVKTTGTGKLITTLGSGASFVFPIGNAYYNPLTIANNTGSSDNFDVRLLDEVYSQGTTGNALISPRVAATWVINKGSGTSNLGNGVDFTFVFDDAQKRGMLTNGNIRLFRYGGTQWIKQAGTGSISAASNTLTYTYTQYKNVFAPFSLGDDLVALPLLWLEISCQRKSVSRSVVQWKTSEEVGVVSFTVERSSDGVQFTPIGTLPAQNGIGAAHSYLFTDADAPSATCFYRIKENNAMGSPSWSRVAVCGAFDPGSANAIEIYPNPSDHHFQISAIAFDGAFQYRLSDAAGKLVRFGNGSAGRAEVNTQDLSRGVYYLQVNISGKRTVHQVLISH